MIGDLFNAVPTWAWGLIAGLCWTNMIKEAWRTRHVGPAYMAYLVAKAEYGNKMAILRKARRTVLEGRDETDDQYQVRCWLLDRLDTLDDEATAALHAARDHFIASGPAVKVNKPAKRSWKRLYRTTAS